MFPVGQVASAGCMSQGAGEELPSLTDFLPLSSFQSVVVFLRIMNFFTSQVFDKIGPVVTVGPVVTFVLKKFFLLGVAYRSSP